MAFIELGKIIKTRGLRGCLKVISCAQQNDIFSVSENIYLQKQSGEKNKYTVKKIDLAGKFLFIELQGIDNKEQAEALLGCRVLLPENLFPQLPENEYYWHDIIGLQVYTQDGDFLGKIEAIFPTGSNDVYVCKNKDSEVLLPSIADVVTDIDLKKGIMTVKLPPGL